jgi:hypothetical protein
MRSIFHRLFGSASAVLISVLAVMAIGIFVLLVMQFRESWQELAHANRISVLAAADRVIYEVTGAIRVGRGTTQTMLLAEDDPRAVVSRVFVSTDDAVLCGGTIRGAVGEVTSPSFATSGTVVLQPEMTLSASLLRLLDACDLVFPRSWGTIRFVQNLMPTELASQQSTSLRSRGGFEAGNSSPEVMWGADSQVF